MSAEGGSRIREQEGRSRRLIVCEDAGELAREGAALFVSRARLAIRRHGRFDVLLSGGSTPRRLYQRLAEQSQGEGFSWKQVHFFWGDERLVPPDSPESNFRMACQALLSWIDIPEENIHRVLTELGEPREVARRYEEELRRHFGNGSAFPSFDLALLGLGREGHTASLFPGSATELEGPDWVIAPYVQKLGAFRISVSLGALESSREVIFLVSGSEKAEILKRVITSPCHQGLLPAQRVVPRQGQLTWLVDRAAAHLLSTEPYLDFESA